MTKIDEQEKLEKIDEQEKMEHAELPIEEKEEENNDYETLKKEHAQLKEEHVKLQEKNKKMEDDFNTFKPSPKDEEEKYYSILDGVKE